MALRVRAGVATVATVGSRMNAVIVEQDGSWTLQGHPRAAEFLDVTLRNEPEAVVSHLRIWEKCEWLYDEVFAEGGVLVNAPTRELVFFGGIELVRTIPMRRKYLEVLAAVWAGWRVRWAWHRTADILGAVGLAASYSLIDPSQPVQWDDAPGGPVLYHRVRDRAGKLRLHRARHRAVRQVLVAGPAILNTIGPGRQTLALPDPMSWEMARTWT